MKTYNKKQRHKIYIKLLEIVCVDPDVTEGICYYIDEACGKDKWEDDDTDIEEFSELVKHRPAPFKQFIGRRYYSRVYWAPTTEKGWETRIKWIQQAIKETK